MPGTGSLRQRTVLVIIVFAQLAGTSLWFAGNAVIEGLSADLGLPPTALGPVTSAVQLGFIAGTLAFAILTIADRFSPSKVFFVSGLIGALMNSALILVDVDYGGLLALRFATGFCLAGIYPVGMKIASDHFPQGLGKALGFLLGALALGTASPHLVRAILEDLPWRFVLLTTSTFCVVGGAIVLLFVPDGPNRRAAKKLDLRVFFKVFDKQEFRSAAFGYFGHMWELYAFWTFVPVMILHFNGLQNIGLPVSLLAFFVIGVGAISCAGGGIIALRRGSARVAFAALLGSGLCCLLSPLIFDFGPILFVAYLLLWGMLVIADSPQFSTLVARTAPDDSTGTALTIVNCIGFSITIASIQLLNYLGSSMSIEFLLLILAVGPVMGLLGMRSLLMKGL